MLHVRVWLNNKPLELEAWTPDLVRKHLPQVLVNMHGKIYPAMLKGCSLNFAQVSIILSEKPWRLVPAFEVSWSTVAHCLNTDKPILY